MVPRDFVWGPLPHTRNGHRSQVSGPSPARQCPTSSSMWSCFSSSQQPWDRKTPSPSPTDEKAEIWEVWVIVKIAKHVNGECRASLKPSGSKPSGLPREPRQREAPEIAGLTGLAERLTASLSLQRLRCVRIILRGCAFSAFKKKPGNST